MIFAMPYTDSKTYGGIAWPAGASKKYRVERSTDGKVTWQVIATGLTSPTAVQWQYKDTAVAPGNSYIYRVTEIDGAGNPINGYSNDVGANILGSVLAPTDLTVRVWGDIVSLNWTNQNSRDPRRFDSPGSLYNVISRRDANNPLAPWVDVGFVPMDQADFEDNEVPNGSYLYEVDAAIFGVAAEGTPSNPVSVSNSLPSAPVVSAPSATPRSAGTVRYFGTPIGGANPLPHVAYRATPFSAAAVFDDQFFTGFSAASPGSNWVGLDLGQQRPISQVWIEPLRMLAVEPGENWPYTSFASDLKGGRIQGSNDAVAWTDLPGGTIADTPPEFGISIPIGGSPSYQYVRYLCPGNYGRIGTMRISGPSPSWDVKLNWKLAGIVRHVRIERSWNGSPFSFVANLNGNTQTWRDIVDRQGSYIWRVIAGNGAGETIGQASVSI